jgi:hypothetical protein
MFLAHSLFNKTGRVHTQEIPLDSGSVNTARAASATQPNIRSWQSEAKTPPAPSPPPRDFVPAAAPQARATVLPASFPQSTAHQARAQQDSQRQARPEQQQVWIGCDSYTYISAGANAQHHSLLCDSCCRIGTTGPDPAEKAWGKAARSATEKPCATISRVCTSAHKAPTTPARPAGLI